MKRFGIIGDPIAHSMSPRLFRAAYGGRYPYDLIEGSDFEASWERFLKDYDGINVTAPFKEKAAAKADILSPAVSRIGASNLIVKTSEGIFADNSDYHGVVLTLRSHNFRCGKALVIGCGGAGKAAAVALFDEGWDVSILNSHQLSIAQCGNIAVLETLSLLLANLVEQRTHGTPVGKILIT